MKVTQYDPPHSPARINNRNILRHAHPRRTGNSSLKYSHALFVRDYMALGWLLVV